MTSTNASRPIRPSSFVKLSNPTGRSSWKIPSPPKTWVGFEPFEALGNTQVIDSKNAQSAQNDTRVIPLRSYCDQLVRAVFEKDPADTIRLNIRRIAALSITVSEVCTQYS